MPNNPIDTRAVSMRSGSFSIDQSTISPVPVTARTPMSVAEMFWSLRPEPCVPVPIDARDGLSIDVAEVLHAQTHAVQNRPEVLSTRCPRRRSRDSRQCHSRSAHGGRASTSI